MRGSSRRLALILADLLIGLGVSSIALAGATGLSLLTNVNAPLALYGVALIASVGMLFARGRPYVAIGLLLPVVLLLFAPGGCFSLASRGTER